MALFKGLFSKKQEQELPKAALKEEPQAQATPEAPKAVIKSQLFKLENMEAHMADILDIVEKNEDFKLSKKALIDECRDGEKIYEYENTAAPTFGVGGGGEIQVFLYNTHIGDIKQGSTARAKKLIDSADITNLSATVSGGKYKYLRYDAGADKYYLDDGETDFSITVEITYRTLSGKR